MDITSNIDYEFTLDSLIQTLELIAAWHKLDEGHGQRTAIMAIKIALRMDNKLDTDQLKLLDYAARIHDLGRIAIDDSIMLKNGPLTTSERGAMETHPAIGYNFLCRSHLPNEIKMVVLCHHEHWDGTGYPQQLEGDEIPLFARIVILADMWDALISDRPYRKGMDFEAALNTMTSRATWFDPKLYAIFLGILKDERDTERHG